MTRLELVSGIIAFVIMAAIGVWILVMRRSKKQEMTKQQRMLAGMGLSVAMALFFLAMPAVIWVKAIGMVLAAVMFFTSLYQWNPKRPEREKNRGKSDKPQAHRSASADYMPYYKRKQQKQKRSK